jgi:hypothetical protein
MAVVRRKKKTKKKGGHNCKCYTHTHKPTHHDWHLPPPTLHHKRRLGLMFVETKRRRIRKKRKKRKRIDFFNIKKVKKKIKQTHTNTHTKAAYPAPFFLLSAILSRLPLHTLSSALSTKSTNTLILFLFLMLFELSEEGDDVNDVDDGDDVEEEDDDGGGGSGDSNAGKDVPVPASTPSRILLTFEASTKSFTYEEQDQWNGKEVDIRKKRH